MTKWYQQLEAQAAALAPQRFKFRPGFIDGHAPLDIPADPEYKTYQMYLVITGNHSLFPILRAAGQERLLTSYYYLRDQQVSRSSTLFARDPESVYTQPEMRGYALAVDSMFERNRPDESTRDIPLAEPVRPAYRRPSA
jgi:hypothetical protein